MMKHLLIVVLCLLFSCTFQSKVFDTESIIKDFEKGWQKYKKHHKLDFQTHGRNEEASKNIFKDHVHYIHEHNKDKSKSYKLGINSLSHLTEEEFKQIRGYKHSEKKVREDKKLFLGVSSAKIPKDMDWRKKKAVTEVKDQGQCGSCWAFSSTGALEGQLAITKAKLVSLSEQDLIDCSRSYGNNGCSGGLMDFAFDYVRDSGINSEKDYRYTASEGKCQHNNKTAVLYVDHYVDIPSDDEAALTAAIATIGPVSVAIQADLRDFQLYSSGIYSNPNCTSGGIDHGVLAVGYGASQAGDYYIVKNSWGGAWGDSGYILIARNKGNMCGIASAATYPVIKTTRTDL